MDGFGSAMRTLFESSIKLSKTVLTLMAIGLQLEVHVRSFRVNLQYIQVQVHVEQNINN